jgi:hypothetical protein
MMKKDGFREERHPFIRWVTCHYFFDDCCFYFANEGCCQEDRLYVYIGRLLMLLLQLKQER